MSPRTAQTWKKYREDIFLGIIIDKHFNNILFSSSPVNNNKKKNNILLHMALNFIKIYIRIAI